MWAKRALQRVLIQVHTFTAACIAMSLLDIDTSRRVVFSRVFLKSAGYLVLQIKNKH